MKKAMIILLLFCSTMCMIFTGCSKGEDTYVAKQVLIDINGDCILLNINNDTLTNYPHIEQGIVSIGDKIKVKDDEVIFYGRDMKGIKATLINNDVNIHFDEVPTFIMKGAKIIDNEIHIYISVNQTLSYLIYKKI